MKPWLIAAQVLLGLLFVGSLFALIIVSIIAESSQRYRPRLLVPVGGILGMLVWVFFGSAGFVYDVLFNEGEPGRLWEVLALLLMYAPVAGVVGVFIVFINTRVERLIQRYKAMSKQGEGKNDANG